MKKFLIHVLILAILVVPVLASAEIPPASSGGLVAPCGTRANPTECGFNDLMGLINKIIRFVLFDLALPLAAIMFAYAGFLLVTSGGSTEALGQAKGIFTNTLIGLIVAVAAWLIVNTLLSILGYQGSWIGFVNPAS